MVIFSQDTLSLLKTFTFRRAWNILRVFVSFYMSKWTRTTFHPALPFAVSIEPTTSCNLRCPECPSGLRSFTRPTGMLDTKSFTSFIEQVQKDISYLIFYFQGEPYLNPNFLKQVQIAKSYSLYTATSTNAHYLTSDVAKQTVESGLDRLIISIDGTTQDTYEQYRVGGQLEKVIEGTKQILHWKKELKSKTPYVIFQFLVVGPNEHQVEEIEALGKSLGVDEVRLKTAQIYEYEQGSHLIPKNEKYARYIKNKEGSYRLKNSLDNHCWKMWHQCVITWDGKVVPCCFDKDAQYTMGNVFQTSLKEVWNNKDYQSFRQSIFESRDQIEICKNCTEGTKVWA